MPSLPRWMQALPLGWLGGLIRKNDALAAQQKQGPPRPQPAPAPDGLPWDGGGSGLAMPAMASAAQTREFLTQEKIRANLASLGNGIRFLPLADSYTEETAEMRRLYRVMLKEPTIKAALVTKILAVAALDLQVHPASKSSRDKQIAEFVEYALNRSKGGVRKIVWNILIGGLLEGYSICEKVWSPPDRKGPWRGRIRLKALKGKDTKFAELLGDQFRNVTAVRDLRGGQNYHPSNFVIWQHLPLFDSPTGMSDLRAAYRAFWLMDTAWQLRAVALDRYSLPVIVGKYADISQKTSFEASLALFRSQSWISLPPDASVEALSLAARGTADFESAIKDLKHDIFLGICGAILQSLEGTVNNGRGDSQVHKDTTQLLQWYLAAEVGDALTDQVVPELVDLNFASADYPTVTLSAIDDSANAASIKVDQALQQMGVALDAEEVYKKYGRSQPPDESAALKPVPKAGPTDMADSPRDQPPQTPLPDSKAVSELQTAVHGGTLSRAAAIANAMLTMGIGRSTAESLFPLPDQHGQNWPPVRPETVNAGGNGAGDQQPSISAYADGGGWPADDPHAPGGLRRALDQSFRRTAAVGPVPQTTPPTTQRAEADYARSINDPSVAMGDGEGGTPILDMPDVRQHDRFSCGAAAAMSVGKYFGVGPDDLEQWKDALGTSVEKSTSPQAIASYLQSLGLTVDCRQNMTVQDLAGCIQRGMPVICPVQDYGPVRDPKAELDYGHYLTVIGMPDPQNIVCQDSSEENVLEPDADSIQEPGRVIIDADVWDANWHDVDAAGNKYMCFGIAVGQTADMCGGAGGKPGPCPVGQSAADQLTREKAAQLMRDTADKLKAIAAKGTSAAVEHVKQTALNAPVVREARAELAKIDDKKVEASLKDKLAAVAKGAAKGAALKATKLAVHRLTGVSVEMWESVSGKYGKVAGVAATATYTALYHSVDVGSLGITALPGVSAVKSYAIYYGIKASIGTIALGAKGAGKAKAALGFADENLTPAVVLAAVRDYEQQISELFGVAPTTWTDEEILQALSQVLGTAPDKLSDTDVGVHGPVFEKAPSDFAAPDATGGDIAGSKSDVHKAEQLLAGARKDAAKAMAAITRKALARMVSRRDPLQATEFYDQSELKQLADVLTKTNATANLLGRSRVRLMAEKVKRHAEGGGDFASFAEAGGGQAFDRFDDSTELTPMRPELAISYFRALTPALKINEPSFLAEIGRTVFTAAAATNERMLERMKDVIQSRLETGQGVSTAPRALNEIMAEGGVSVANPQYSELVVRTNMMNIYTAGTMEELNDPDVADIFPGWIYDGIDDGRAGEDHKPHFGKAYKSSVDFADVRDSLIVKNGAVVRAGPGEGRPFNCRCNPRPLSKFEMKARGIKLLDAA